MADIKLCDVLRNLNIEAKGESLNNALQCQYFEKIERCDREVGLSLTSWPPRLYNRGKKVPRILVGSWRRKNSGNFFLSSKQVHNRYVYISDMVNTEAASRCQKLLFSLSKARLRESENKCNKCKKNPPSGQRTILSQYKHSQIIISVSSP